jgi:hypothetical protein
MKEHARTRRGEPYSAGHRNNQFRAVKPFFGWLLREGEITADPMEHLTAPTAKVPVVPVLTDTQITALLAQVERHKDFDSRRDLAILRLFLCSGVRLGELTGLTEGALDLPRACATVLGKGKQEAHGKVRRPDSGGVGPVPTGAGRAQMVQAHQPAVVGDQPPCAPDPQRRPADHLPAGGSSGSGHPPAHVPALLFPPLA